jgi:CDP-diacylglycerol--glycerol-3-phosphate 3-phosphatidyltransferase
MNPHSIPSSSPKPKHYPLRPKEEIFNLPNMLTLGRIGMIPIVVLFLYFDTPLTCFIATVLYSLAAVTDFVDGWLARNRNMISTLGKFMDPLADKLLVMACLVMMVVLDRVPAWLVIILLAREIAITGLRSIASSEDLSIDVIQTGKWKTALQMSSLVCLLLGYRYSINFLFVTVEVDLVIVGLAVVLISMFFSILSAYRYFQSFIQSIMERNRAIEQGRGK